MPALSHTLHKLLSRLNPPVAVAAAHSGATCLKRTGQDADAQAPPECEVLQHADELQALAWKFGRRIGAELRTHCWVR